MEENSIYDKLPEGNCLWKLFRILVEDVDIKDIPLAPMKIVPNKKNVP